MTIIFPELEGLVRVKLGMEGRKNHARSKRVLTCGGILEDETGIGVEARQTGER